VEHAPATEYLSFCLCVFLLLCPHHIYHNIAYSIFTFQITHACMHACMRRIVIGNITLLHNPVRLVQLCCCLSRPCVFSLAFGWHGWPRSSVLSFFVLEHIHREDLRVVCFGRQLIGTQPASQHLLSTTMSPTHRQRRTRRYTCLLVTTCEQQPHHSTPLILSYCTYSSTVRIDISGRAS
jgi:hypothetical protein